MAEAAAAAAAAEAEAAEAAAEAAARNQQVSPNGKKQTQTRRAQTRFVDCPADGASAFS